MDSPKSHRLKLTAAQKKAGIKLVKGWKKPEHPDPADIYRCFASPARINGKKAMIGVSESAELKRQAAFRGMTTKKGKPKPNLSWQQQLVIAMRVWTTREEFNHEWWGAKTLELEWVKKVDEIYRDDWLYFPSHPKQLAAKALGTQVGYYLALGEAKLELAAANGAYLKKLEEVELERAKRPHEKEERKKVRVEIAGFDSWKQAIDASYQNFLKLRGEVVSMVGALAPREDFGEFFEGLVSGKRRASHVDLKDELSDYNKTEEVVAVLLEYWESIYQLPNRAEISRFIRNHLPDDKRKRLEDEKAEPWKSFCVWMREIYDKIGLSPSRKGRPRNK